MRAMMVLLLVAACTHSAAAAPAVDGKVTAFLNMYCLECHGPKQQKADFRVDELKLIATAADAEYWRLVLDNLNLGQMPPKKAKLHPRAAEVEPIAAWITGELTRASRELKGIAGEVVLRRLNRTEYRHTIEDLFAVRGDFTDGFPADAKAEGFDNNGAALSLSAEQVGQYLHAAQFVIGRAIVTKPRPETRLVKVTLADLNKKIEENKKKQEEYRRKNPPSETERKQEEEQRKKGNFGHGYYPAYGDDFVIPMKYMKPNSRDFFYVREPGWYRVKVVGYAALNRQAGAGGAWGVGGEQVLRLQVERTSYRQGMVPEIAGTMQFSDEKPKEAEFRIYLENNEHVQLVMLDGPNWMWGSRIGENKEPVVAVKSFEMEGPLYDQWPPAGHRTLLGERDATKLRDEEMPAVLAELAPRLFRRPVKAEVVKEYVDFYTAARKESQPLDAFKLTAKAMMASPQFLYHVETGDKPDDYALANRLSYFLWRSVPDAALYEAAAAKKLGTPEEIRRQVDRMLADAKSQRFLEDFAGKWLGIDRVGEMKPDEQLYPEYDDELERAMVAETRAFIREILQHDLSLANLIDSDWAMLNDRMAKHYGIAGVRGNEFRKVKLDKSATPRGGLLTQASILNITSNGTTTSPVVRGVWILERLLGTPAPPPPPDVPAIEPDIRGASTIQEQMAKHRTIDQCASCHVRIDPYGLALENFDVTGGWREKYRALKPTNNPNRPKLGDGQTVIAADELPGLGAYKTFAEFRQLLVKREGLVFDSMAHKLATFALGRAMTFADEAELRDIAARTKANGGGMKTMIRELAASPLFRRP